MISACTVIKFLVLKSVKTMSPPRTLDEQSLTANAAVPSILLLPLRLYRAVDTQAHCTYVHMPTSTTSNKKVMSDFLHKLHNFFFQHILQIICKIASTHNLPPCSLETHNRETRRHRATVAVVSTCSSRRHSQEPRKKSYQTQPQRRRRVNQVLVPVVLADNVSPNRSVLMNSRRQT